MSERSIIVMKGYPCTRKSEFADAIARSLNCPLFSLEDVLDSLTPPLSPEKEYEAFKVICKIAIRHIHSELFKTVVIDSPLSSKSHLIHLRNCVWIIARVIVIECKPANTYSWRLKFQHHLARCQSRYGEGVEWYKAKKWEDVEKAIQQHPDYDVIKTESSSSTFVSKLVVDPLFDCPFEGPYGTQSRLVEAVKYMMTRGRWDTPKVVVYQQWLQKHLSSSSPLGEKHCSAHGHDIVKGIQHDETTVDCMVCRRQVMRSNAIGDEYCHCKNCSLTLHMECARFPRRRRHMTSSVSAFPCKPCMEGVTDKSIGCKACEFKNHIPQNRPLAIKHFDTSEHFLTIILKSNNEAYRCIACGEKSTDVYLCKDCGVAYHNECVTMPRRVKNVHGGHHHHMSLKFESEEAENYLCQECQELRDPALWYYSCEDCPGYELHPHCVVKLREWKLFTADRERMDGEAEIEAAERLYYTGMKMKEFESISDFYSRVIYMIQWYGDLREEAKVFKKIITSLPLKFYHIVVAIKRSKDYRSMTVDQLMISLRLYEKKIDNGDDVLIEQVLANLYATQRSSYQRGGKYYTRKYKKSIMKVKDVSFKSVLRTDYSKQESGDNWVKHWGKYWDNYWFNYQRGFYSSEDKSKMQCSICYMFGHDPRHCWKVSNKVKKKPLKIKINLKMEFKCLIQSHSS